MMRFVRLLFFFAGTGAIGLTIYAIAGYIGRVGRWILAVLALLAVPAFVSAGFSHEIRGYPLVVAVAIAAGSAVGMVVYGIRHARGAEPQQYLS
jgi:putative effector of murein hydrolase LrgA (UPF0299 family)